MQQKTLVPIVRSVTGNFPSLTYSVAVVGLGYVGLPLALLAARKGHRVVGLDINAEKVKSINSGICPFFDVELTERLANTRLPADTNFARARDVEIIVLCVPTPVRHDHIPDLVPIMEASKSVASHLKKGTLVIVESTVNPGVCENVVLPILERGSGLRAGADFMLSHCPERVNPGDPEWNVENISRVAGSLTEEGLEKTLAFYGSIVTGPIRPMRSIKEAEAVKIVENTFRDINIAFVNELALSFDRLGIDVVNVIEAAATKPFAFMAHYPGCGVGGHCIPVDPYYLIAEGKRNGFNHRFLSLARKINNHMPKHTVDLLERMLRKEHIPLKGARVALLGLAYKADIDDVRESPSLVMLEELEKRGAEVMPFDPYVKNARIPTLRKALTGAHAAIVATPHRSFRALSPHDFLECGVSIVIDGKNCLSKEAFVGAGVQYRGIGR